MSERNVEALAQLLYDSNALMVDGGNSAVDHVERLHCREAAEYLAYHGVLAPAAVKEWGATTANDQQVPWDDIEVALSMATAYFNQHRQDREDVSWKARDRLARVKQWVGTSRPEESPLDD
jgi:hypothetical protein